MPRHSPELSVLAAHGAMRRVPLKDRTTIGRAEESDIQLPDHALSRQHAEIWRREDGHYLRDVGSTNGTFLNGSRLTREERLCDGDTISLGDSRLVFHEHPWPGQRITAVRAAGDGGNLGLPDAPAEIIDVANLSVVNRALGVLAQATSSLLGPVPVSELLDKILQLAFEAVSAERGAIMFMEGEPPQPVVHALRLRPGQVPVSHLSRSIVDRVVDNGMALLLRDLRLDPTLSSRQSIIEESIVSAVCAPMWLAGDGALPTRVLGLLYLDSRSEDRIFGATDLQIVTALANIAAAKIESGRLFDELLDKKMLDEDMRRATEIQQNLLPAAPPRVPGYDIAGVSRPSRSVGGDYFDFGQISGSTLALALADVSGKGLGAAMLMVALRTSVRTYWDGTSLADACSQINRSFAASVPDGQYATLLLAHLHAPTGRVQYVNAGHFQPLVIGADGNVRRLTEGGTIVGAFEAATYEQGEAQLAPGETLLVFSDGVTDAFGELERAEGVLVEITRRHASEGSASVAAEILRAVEVQSEGRANDDRTALVVRRLSEAEGLP